MTPPVIVRSVMFPLLHWAKCRRRCAPARYRKPGPTDCRYGVRDRDVLRGLKHDAGRGLLVRQICPVVRTLDATVQAEVDLDFVFPYAADSQKIAQPRPPAQWGRENFALGSNTNLSPQRPPQFA